MFTNWLILEIIFPSKVGKGTFVQAIPLPQKCRDVYPYPKIKIDLTEFIFSLKSGGTCIWFIQAIPSSSKVDDVYPHPPPPPLDLHPVAQHQAHNVSPVKSTKSRGAGSAPFTVHQQHKEMVGGGGVEWCTCNLIILQKAQRTYYIHVHMHVIYQLMAACDSIFFLLIKILTC